jgi:manganese/zinc/iron transport system substrate-binding protein
LGDQRRLEEADAVFYNGLHLEGRLTDVLENLGKRKATIAVTDVLVREHQERLLKPAEFEGAYDPHVWFDVELWSKCVAPVRDQLAELDPDHAEAYRANAKRYVEQLLELDQECRDQLMTVPSEQRLLVTAHDAFGYFGKAYDVEVHGLQGISTVDEADLANVNRLVELLVDRKIKAVFVESSVPERNVRNLIQGCAARGHEVVKGGELFSDAMGEPGTPEGTYLGMVRHNLRTIVEALK